GPCVDGVCCDSACTGQCEACDLAGHVGVCSPATGAPHGARTACETDGTACGGACNGARRDACTFPASAVTCRAPSCVDGGATLAGQCLGDGHCAAKQEQKCAPSTCGATACRGDCHGDGDCDASAFCSGNVCTPKLADGATCGGDAQCASSHCVDGVCCDTGCTDQCAACNVAGHVGTCSASAGAPRGGRAACAGSGACAGQCDGVHASACALPGAATECAAASCHAGAATGAARCDGHGTCATVPSTSCAPYGC